MKLSHSKLSCILSCPMTYFLTYRECIFPKVTKAALSIGSATHWGIEHDVEDLTEYYKQQNTYTIGVPFTRDQLLAEAMVHGYRKYKKQIFDDILIDKDGSRAELLDEQHELFLTGKLKSYTHPTMPHSFVGIIDLLLLTSKGFVIIDYKTSTAIPDWNNYLDQIYRYIFLLKSAFPDTPIYKIGIVNLRKTKIRQKNGENVFAFLERMKFEYDVNDENYVNWHMFDPDTLDKKVVDEYIDNLSRMADTADMIDTNNMWFINYSAANGQYGKSPYWDIFYHTTNAYVLYNIKDTILDPTTKKLQSWRDCRPLDMKVIDEKNVLNKYDIFKAQAIAFYSIREDINKDELFEYLRKNFIVDDKLLEDYWTTLSYEISKNNEK